MNLDSKIKASVWAAIKSEDFHDGDIEIIKDVEVEFELETLKDLDILRNLVLYSVQNKLSDNLDEDQTRLYAQFSPELKSLKMNDGLRYFCDVQIMCDKAEQLLSNLRRKIKQLQSENIRTQERIFRDLSTSLDTDDIMTQSISIEKNNIVIKQLENYKNYLIKVIGVS